VDSASRTARADFCASAGETDGARAARIRIDDDGPGVGLGLAIVAEIVRAHSGTVRIEDGPGGRGTRIAIELPLATGQAGQAGQGTARDAATRPAPQPAP